MEGLVQGSRRLEDKSRWPSRWSVLCVSLSFRSHLKSSPLKWFGREAPRSEAFVHEERVVYRPCQRSSPSTSKDLVDMDNDDGDLDLPELLDVGETNSRDPHLYTRRACRSLALPAVLCVELTGGSDRRSVSTRQPSPFGCCRRGRRRAASGRRTWRRRDHPRRGRRTCTRRGHPRRGRRTCTRRDHPRRGRRTFTRRDHPRTR